MDPRQLKAGIIITSIIVAAAAVGFGIYYIQKNLLFRPHGTVTVISIPFDLTVTDGDRTQTIDTKPPEGMSLAVRAGERTLEFSADGFTSSSQTISVEDGSEQTIYVSLDPSEDWSAEEVLNDDIYGYRREAMAGGSMEAGSAEIEQKYPFVNRLPIQQQWYEVYVCNATQELVLEPNELGICINFALDNATQRENAMKDIEDAGIDASQYKVIVDGELI